MTYKMGVVKMLNTSMNPYQILNINKNATVDEIKTAYRNLAKQYHPDINQSADAAHKFREIQEAYNQLQSKKAPNSWDIFNNFNNSSLFKDIHITHTITLEEAYSGTELSININNKIIVVAVPMGIENNTALHVRHIYERHNLIVHIKIANHSIFKREKHDLYVTIDVDVMFLLKRLPITLKKINGDIIKIEIPEKFCSQDVLQINDAGMKTPSHTGKLFVKFNIKFDFGSYEKTLL